MLSIIHRYIGSNNLKVYIEKTGIATKNKIKNKNIFEIAECFDLNFGSNYKNILRA
jgi:hypothetical protein